jgi:ATP-dependent RNA helicase DDX54/DBP10
VNQFFICKSIEKIATLLFIMQELVAQKAREQTIIFAATRHHVEYLYEVT